MANSNNVQNITVNRKPGSRNPENLDLSSVRKPEKLHDWLNTTCFELKNMARGRKAKSTRRRSPKTISVLNTMESLTYASILTEGLAGTSLLGLFGKGDLRAPQAGYSGPITFVNPDGVVSLQDMINQPALALQAVQGNFMNNYQSMALSAFYTNIGYRFGRKLLRKPIANVNRNIMKELGLGVRI